MKKIIHNNLNEKNLVGLNLADSKKYLKSFKFSPSKISFLNSTSFPGSFADFYIFFSSVRREKEFRFVLSS